MSLKGVQERKQYLAKRIPIRNAVELVNAINLDGYPVATIAEPTVGALNSDLYSPTWYNHKFLNDFSAAKTEKDFSDILSDRGIEFFIVDNNWLKEKSSVLEEWSHKRRIIENSSTLLAEYGPLSVRKLKSSDFSSELLTNSSFSSSKGWCLAPGCIYDESESKVTVNVKSPATQVVPAKSGRKYRNSIIVKSSGKPSEARIQINWMGADSKIIEATIEVVACDAEWREFSMDVTAPLKTVAANVYCSGHSNDYVEFKKNSLCR